MRVIIVGVHNKVGLSPLCSTTKSGKLIDRIESKLSKPIEKTNLFNIDHMPIKGDKQRLIDEWFWTHLPTDEDIIVLLGGIVHKEFKHKMKNVIKIKHPASQWSHKAMNEYVLCAVGKINKYCH
jgi:hypothetical protein